MDASSGITPFFFNDELHVLIHTNEFEESSGRSENILVSRMPSSTEKEMVSKKNRNEAMNRQTNNKRKFSHFQVKNRKL